MASFELDSQGETIGKMGHHAGVAFWRSSHDVLLGTNRTPRTAWKMGHVTSLEGILCDVCNKSITIQMDTHTNMWFPDPLLLPIKVKCNTAFLTCNLNDGPIPTFTFHCFLWVGGRSNIFIHTMHCTFTHASLVFIYVYTVYLHGEQQGRYYIGFIRTCSCQQISTNFLDAQRSLEPLTAVSVLFSIWLSSGHWLKQFGNVMKGALQLAANWYAPCPSYCAETRPTMQKAD